MAQKQEQLKEADEYMMVKAGEEVEAVVVGLSEVQTFHHEKFGDKPYVDVDVEFNGIHETLKLFLPRNKMIRPDSTAGKLFKAYKVNKLSGLVGKKILLRANKDGYWRFAEEEE